MNALSSKELIRKFIVSQLAKTKEHTTVTDQDNLITNGLIDSLGIMQLISYLEETFSIMIKDEEIVPDYFESIEAISLLLQGKLSTTKN